MDRWLRRIRGAVGMGLAWAAGWALVGVLIGLGMEFLSLPMGWFVEVFDAPLPALAVPGFFAFSSVLGIAGRHRRFDELSVPRFGVWGAVGGLLLALFPVVVGTVSVGTAAVIIGTLTLLSAASASGSLALARLAQGRESSDGENALAPVRIADGSAATTTPGDPGRDGVAT